MRGQREIAEDGEAECKGDRHAGKHRGGDDADEEDQEIEIAELRNTGPATPEQRDDHSDRAERSEHGPRRAGTQQPQQRKDAIKPDADRHRRGAPGVGDFECRRRDRQLDRRRIR